MLYKKIGKLAGIRKPSLKDKFRKLRELKNLPEAEKKVEVKKKLKK